MNENEKERFWKEKISEHWKAFFVAIIAGIACAIVAVLVLIWHIETSPIGAYGTATFDQWSLHWVVVFVIVLILWELLFVGLPAGLFFGLGGYLWWRMLSEEERQEFRAYNEKEESKSHSKNAGGPISFFFFIAYCIYIAIDGNYQAEFGSQPYSYWVYSYLLTVGWVLIIFGIPAAIIVGILYFTKWRK